MPSLKTSSLPRQALNLSVVTMLTSICFPFLGWESTPNFSPPPFRCSQISALHQLRKPFVASYRSMRWSRFRNPPLDYVQKNTALDFFVSRPMRFSLRFVWGAPRSSNKSICTPILPRRLSPEDPLPRRLLPEGPLFRRLTPEGPLPRKLLPEGPLPRRLSPEGPLPRRLLP